MRNTCTNSNLKNIYMIKKEKVNNCYDLISALYREIKPNVVYKSELQCVDHSTYHSVFWKVLIMALLLRKKNFNFLGLSFSLTCQGNRRK